MNCAANWFLRHGSSHQTSFRTWQPHNAWITSSTPTWQRSQTAFRVTFLMNRFFFVGRDSRHARQIKCLILFGTSKSQIWFQELLWAEGFEGPTVEVLESNLYALFVVYFPDVEPAQISVSGTWRELRESPEWFELLRGRIRHIHDLHPSNGHLRQWLHRLEHWWADFSEEIVLCSHTC